MRTLGYEHAERIGRTIIELYQNGQFDVATLFFSRFRSVMLQIPTALQIIPPVFPERTEAGAVYEYEPDELDILAELLPRNISVQVFRALLENAASEQGARMTRHGQCHPQRRRNDQEAAAAHEPHAPGDDHQGADRDHLGGGGAVEGFCKDLIDDRRTP